MQAQQPSMTVGAAETSDHADFGVGWRAWGRPRSLVRSSSTMPCHSLHQIVPTWHCIEPGSRGGRREAYIPAQHSSPCEEARFPVPHEHAGRPSRAEEPPRQGPRPALGLIRRVRGRPAFARLAKQGTRIRRSALWCTWCHEPDSTATHVAFAIGRAYGPAVQRNQLRRRLRSLLRELDSADPMPPGLLLIGARPNAVELTFDQLRAELTELTQQVRRRLESNA